MANQSTDPTRVVVTPYNPPRTAPDYNSSLQGRACTIDYGGTPGIPSTPTPITQIRTPVPTAPNSVVSGGRRKG